MHEEDLKTELIKNGKYFSEAIKWHNFKFHYAFAERTWLFIFLLAMLFIASTVVVNIYTLLPLSTPVQFVRYTDDPYNEIPIMKSLHQIYKMDKELQDVVDKYLITSYVEVVEGTENLEYRKNYLRENSSYQIYNQLLASKGSSRVIIKNITLQKNNASDKNAGKAVVEFYSEDEPKQLKKVLLTFKSSNILLAHKKIVPLSFIVVNYDKL